MDMNGMNIDKIQRALREKAKTYNEWRKLEDEWTQKNMGLQVIGLYVLKLIPLEDVTTLLKAKLVLDHKQLSEVMKKIKSDLPKMGGDLAWYIDIRTLIPEKELLSASGETEKILSDKPLMNAIRRTRKSGSKSSPYKSLVTNEVSKEPFDTSIEYDELIEKEQHAKHQREIIDKNLNKASKETAQK